MIVQEGDELCFPKLLNSSCRKPEPPHLNTLLIYVLLFFISLLTVVLNMLVIISISYFRQLHTPTNFLLLSLAVTDFLVGSLLIPVEMLLTQTCWILGDLMCVLYYLVSAIVMSVSVGSMVLISVDRYVAICDPLHYSIKVTAKNVARCILLVCIFSFFYNIMAFYDSLRQPGRYKSCDGECVVNILGAVDVIVSFICPISVIVVLYLRVFAVALSQARAMRSQVTTTSLTHSKAVKVEKSEIKAARTLGILIVVFLFCYSPYYCVALTGYNLLIGSSTEAILVFLIYFNSCLNPIIYTLFYPWFKKSVRLIVTFQKLQPDTRCCIFS